MVFVLNVNFSREDEDFKLLRTSCSPFLRVIANLMAGILISYGFNPNPLRRGYNRSIYTKILDINVYS